MRFSELYTTGGRPRLSFEFFPPKEIGQLDSTKRQILELGELNPDFVTITYGAAGSTRGFSQELVRFVKEETELGICPHLTCVGHSKSELVAHVDELLKQGVSNILALRGDPPIGQGTFQPHPEGFSCARDFVTSLRDRVNLSVAVAGYPEVHREAASKDNDLKYLKEKIDAGAEVIFTQLFFDEKVYFDFVESARKMGITAPIIPGVMPISNVQQLERFTKMCGANVPERIKSELQMNSERVIEYGIDEAIRLCRALLGNGAPGLHFYTLNKSVQVRPIVEELSLHF